MMMHFGMFFVHHAIAFFRVIVNEREAKGAFSFLSVLALH